MSNKLVPYGYIYKTTNKINGKIYIGQHKGKDFDYTYIGSGGCHFQRALTKYGKENFECFPLVWCWTKEELDNKEIEFIAYFNSTNKNIGYNITLGGGGCLGYTHTEDTKEKLKQLNIGKTLSTETKKKLSELHIGKTLTKETKEKISKAKKGTQSFLGKKHTQETKEKISTYHKGKKISEETKEKIRKANLGKELSEEHKRKIGASNTGKKPSDKVREKISKTLLGKKFSEERLKNLRETLKKKREQGIYGNSAKRIYCLETDKTYNSIADCVLDLNISRPTIAKILRKEITNKFTLSYA